MCTASKYMASKYVVDLCDKVRTLEIANAELLDLLAGEDAFSAFLIDEISRLNSSLRQTRSIALHALAAACADCDVQGQDQAAKLLS